jgi:hypothetical protein
MVKFLRNTEMFKTIIEKIEEVFSNFWVKLIALIPVCFFDFSERERTVIFALLVIMMIDCLFGAMKAKYVNQDFSWVTLSKKFSLKFILYFFFLAASFILSKAFSLIEWWFYAATALILFSEFGSLATKAQKLGLPIKLDIITALNCKLENWILGMIKSSPAIPEEEKEEIKLSCYLPGKSGEPTPTEPKE